MDEEILTGGGVNEVVRVGATVRRPTGPHSPRVHDLLRRLEGFAGIPRVHSAAAGVEVLDFLPGQVSNYPLTPAAASVTALVSAAEFLRRFHDATAGFARELPRDGWMFPVADPVEVVCHGDYAPHNCVLDGERVVALIDFDTARPGPRLTDLGGAVYRWAQVSDPRNPGVPATQEQAARLARFCAAYGLDDADRAGLLDAVIEHLDGLVRHMHEQAAAGVAAFASHIADGHDALYRSDVAHVQANRPLFQDAIGG
ncbi:phosphotransferase enzyme family protein [Kineococcus rhizosphaerae]|uniref:Phosphotransferase family enzyme n=1 Tax=Kineococcus rhizosphaerae TaxID=559628 RepID=A0A2T0R6U2_9ACTN|nr:aminoglycoside phosphotransferase family protein [Kineococcus rhizosphaerae]PRY16887.1 phosphotransferase family enzyme [Kineococcus rhizosphaerae]